MTYTASADATAPFSYLNGATIQNLKTTGTISTSKKYSGGIAGIVFGTNTISNCESDVVIKCGNNGDGTHGGFIGRLSSGTTTFNNCLFSGSIEGSTTTSCGGFIGWTETNSGSVTINNSLQNGNFSTKTDNCYTFSRARNLHEVTLTNCYYVETYGSDNTGNGSATQVTAEQLKNGEVAYKLQNGGTALVWGETIASGATPQLVSFCANALRVCKVTFVNTDGSKSAIRYVRSGETLANFPTAAEMGYKSDATYTCNGAAFTTETVVTGDITVTVGGTGYIIIIITTMPTNGAITVANAAVVGSTMHVNYNADNGYYLSACDITYTDANNTKQTIQATYDNNLTSGTATFTMPAADVTINATFSSKASVPDDDFYLIGSQTEWDAFVEKVKKAPTTNAKLTANISVTTMVGTSAVPYQGTFDGQGHTLSVNYTASADATAPFSYLNGATIKNLHTISYISTSTYKYSGGIAGIVSGTNAITNCVSHVHIDCENDGDGSHGGFIGKVSSGTTTFNNCLFSGSIKGSTTTGCGGFIGLTEDGGSVTINNSLQNGTFSTKTDNCYTFSRARDLNKVTLTNCYYVNTYGSDNTGNGSATKATEDQMNSGEVAYKLQNGGTTLVWCGGGNSSSPDYPVLASFVQHPKWMYKVTFANAEGATLAVRYAHDKESVKIFPTAMEMGYKSNVTFTYNNVTFTTETIVTGDITVTVSGTGYNITVSSTDHGTSAIIIWKSVGENALICVPVAVAVAGSTVRVNYEAANGYYLSSCDVTYTANTQQTIHATYDLAQTIGTATFTMPAADVTIKATFTEYPTVKIGTVTGATAETSSTNAAPGATVAVTVKPEDGYVGNLSYTDAKGNVTTFGSNIWYAQTATFTMPSSNVTINGSFAAINSSSNLTINMPASGTLSLHIPLTYGSLHVYDDGGPSGCYSANSNGNLVLTAPEGYVIRLQGTLSFYFHALRYIENNSWVDYISGLMDKTSSTNSVTLSTLSYTNIFGACDTGFDLAATIYQPTLSVTPTATLTVDGKPASGYWATLYTDVARAIPSGVTAYYIQDGKADDGWVDLVPLTGSVLPAGSACLLNYASSSALSFTYTETAATDAITDNLLKGGRETTTDAEGGYLYYILGRTGTSPGYNYGFYWQNISESGVGDGTKVVSAAYKAYLKVPASSSGKAKSMALSFGVGTTGVDAAGTAEWGNGGDAWYTLGGKKLNGKPAKSGIYISNGNKVIIK